MAVLDAAGREKLNVIARLVDEFEEQTGTTLSPLFTKNLDENINKAILIELRLVTHYLAAMLGETFDIRDLGERDRN